LLQYFMTWLLVRTRTDWEGLLLLLLLLPYVRLLMAVVGGLLLVRGWPFLFELAVRGRESTQQKQVDRTGKQKPRTRLKNSRRFDSRSYSFHLFFTLGMG